MPVQDLGYSGDASADQWQQQLMAMLQGGMGQGAGPGLPQPAMGAGAGASLPQGTPAQPQASALGTGSGAPGGMPGVGAYPPSSSYGQGVSPQMLAMMAQQRQQNQANAPSPYAANMMATAPAGALSGDFPIPREAVPPVQPPVQPPRVAAAPAAPIDPFDTRSSYGGPTAAVDAASPRMSPAAGNMPWPSQRDPQGVWGPRPNAVNPTAAPTATPAGTATAAPAAPNLGYYRPAVGNARQAQWVPPGAGRMAPPLPGPFPGPLAAPQPGATAAPTAATAAPPAAPAAAAAAAPPAAAQIQPGQPGYIGPGTKFLRSLNLFGGNAGANANG